jgi:hypothetical protein
VSAGRGEVGARHASPILAFIEMRAQIGAITRSEVHVFSGDRLTEDLLEDASI